MALQKQVGKPEVKRLPLLGAMSNRDAGGSKDQRFVNIFPESRKVEAIENTKIYLNKRPGLTLYKDFGSGEGRGIIHFNNKFYVAIGNTVYEDGVTPTAKVTLTTSTGPLGMIECNSSTLGNYLFICDGIGGWVIKDDGTVNTITNTSVHSIVLTTTGSGYGQVPTVTISAPTTGTTATASATVTSGVVTSIVLESVGQGYVSVPTVTISPPILTFDPTTTVSTTDDTITITSHTYSTGVAVTYSKGGGTVIGGLVEGTLYYIIRVDENTIKLATTLANASTGTAINLTSKGTGTTHTFTGLVAAAATATLTSFPDTHIPVPTFIDGYVILASGSDVYNSDLDNPMSWSASNFLSAEMFPDPIVTLMRQNNQVVVGGGNSIEFFYDAANIAGSPLSRNDSTTIQMGIAAPYCTYQSEQYCAYISQSQTGGRAVWLIDGFKPKKVSDEFIERILDAESDMTSTRGFGVRIKGHMFFVINLKTQNRTLVYDLDEKLWHEWASGSSTVFNCDHITDKSLGYPYLLDNSNGCVYKFDVGCYNDNGSAITVSILTNKFDMDTYHRKTMYGLRLIGDSYTSTNPITLQWSDDDYKTFSNAKTIDLESDLPVWRRLGNFRRRAFKFTHTANQPLRLESIEVEYQENVN